MIYKNPKRKEKEILGDNLSRLCLRDKTKENHRLTCVKLVKSLSTKLVPKEGIIKLDSEVLNTLQVQI